MTMTQFKVNQLRAKNSQTLLEVIAILLASVFVTVLLPQLLFRYLYADQQLTAEPPLLQAIPTIAFAVGILYALYGLVMNFLRERQIAQLTKQMEDQALSLSTAPVDAEELAKLESVVEKAMDAEARASKSKKSKAKKTTKS